MLLHHPALAVATLTYLLFAVTVKLDATSLVIALMPTAAVIVDHFLSRRQVSSVKSDAVEIKHTINSQHDDLKAELATVRKQNDALQDRLSALPPPEST